MYGKSQASRLPEFIPFISTSALWGQILSPCLPQGVAEVVDGCSVITPTSSSSSVTLGEGSICWITVLGALILLWRPELANGCDISCLFIGLLIWEEIFSIHTAIHPNLPEELSDPPSFSSVLKVQWRGSPCQSSG